MPPCCLSPEHEKSLTFSEYNYALPARTTLNYFGNAINRERLVRREYAYHDLYDQRLHWSRTDAAYEEVENVQADHARHRKYRSYVRLICTAPL